ADRKKQPLPLIPKRQRLPKALCGTTLIGTHASPLDGLCTKPCTVTGAPVPAYWLCSAGLLRDHFAVRLPCCLAPPGSSLAAVTHRYLFPSTHLWIWVKLYRTLPRLSSFFVENLQLGA